MALEVFKTTVALHVLRQTSFVSHADLLHHAPRSGVSSEVPGMDAIQPEYVES